MVLFLLSHFFLETSRELTLVPNNNQVLWLCLQVELRQAVFPGFPLLLVWNSMTQFADGWGKELNYPASENNPVDK